MAGGVAHRFFEPVLSGVAQVPQCGCISAKMVVNREALGGQRRERAKMS
jgi:hypothetical protein